MGHVPRLRCRPLAPELNLTKDDMDFVSRQVQPGTVQNVFILGDNAIVQPGMNDATSQPINYLARRTVRVKKPRHEDVRIKDRNRLVPIHGRARRSCLTSDTS